MVTGVRLVVSGLLGLAFGSFLTVVAYRVPRGESIVAPGSRCPACGSPIRPRDNVPVLSYVLLRGRCRDCRARIPVRYPLIELTTAALFVAATEAFGPPYLAIILALFFAVMVAVAEIDIERRIVPNRVTYPALVAFAALIGLGVALGEPFDLSRAGLGFLAYGGGLLVVAFVSPRGMGMGDVKLAALIGLVLGSLGLAYVAVAAAAAILGGAVASIALLARGASRKAALPFGPYLAAGAVLATFVTPRVASWYLAAIR